jgi:hypothetical protein
MRGHLSNVALSFEPSSIRTLYVGIYMGRVEESTT